MDLNIQLQILCRYNNFPITTTVELLAKLRFKIKNKQLFPILGQYYLLYSYFLPDVS